MIFETGGLKPCARKMETPGRFCDAIVTTNNGIAMPMTARKENTGVTHTGAVNPHLTLSRWKRPCAIATAVPISNIAGTLYRGHQTLPAR